MNPITKLAAKAYNWMGDYFQFRNGQFERVWATPETKSGIVINERNALGTVALLRAVSIIAGAAGLPIDVTRRNGSRRERLQGHPAELLLDNQPNPEMSTMDLRHFQWLSYLLWGNSYTLIVRRPDEDGTPIALWPLQPDCMEVKRRESTGELVYLYTPPGTGIPKPYPMDEILHIRGISLDGINGLSPIRLAAESLGLNRSMEQYAARFMKGGMGQRVIVNLNNPNVNDQQIEQLQRDWDARYGGIDNYDRPVFFRSDGKVATVGVNPRDAQLIELMQLNDEKVAMLYGVPPHMMGLVSKTTSWGTGIAEQKLGFTTFTLQTHLTFFEKAYERCLLSDKDREVSIKHNLDAYLRADYKTRMEGHATAVDKGLMNRDEARALEDMDPIEDGSGKIYTVQQQFVPLGMTGEIAMRGKATEGNANAA